MRRPSGNSSSRARQLALTISALAAFSVAGCSDDDNHLGGGSTKNLPPGVWLVSAPPEGDSTSYRVYLQWGGSDPDGDVAYYEYAITDNDGGAFIPADTVGRDKWHKVFGEDSTFVFSADQLADSTTDDLVSRFERSHTFFIRAIDDRGLPSVETAYRSFTAWTLSPDAWIQIPRYTGTTPALMPSIGTFHWVARDFVNSLQEVIDPDSVRWILHPVEGGDFAGGIDFIRRNPHSDEWYPWADYKAPDDAGKSWTTPPTNVGEYVFAVQAMDEAGAVTPVFDERYNIRRVRVSNIDTSPLLDVYNEYIGTLRSSTPTPPLVIVDLPDGLPMQFRWTADAGSYGGVVVAYRYGWDIYDLDDPDQWEIDPTPFVGRYASSPPRAFYFGVHTFHVEVIDNSGFKSRAEVKMNIIPFAMSREILLVDDYNVQSDGIEQTNGSTPSDAEHDAFWQSMVGDVAGFSPVSDAIAVTAGSELSITKLADYKTIIWDAFGGYNVSASLRPKLWNLIHFRSKDASTNPVVGKVQPNLLALFIGVGGRLMLCGHQPMTQAITTGGFFPSAAKYPLVFKFELEGDQDGSYGDQLGWRGFVGDKSFPYKDGCLNVIDIAYPAFVDLRGEWQGCDVYDIHGTDPTINGLREALSFVPEFPTLELRAEVAGPGRRYAPGNGGLNAEVYNPPYFADCPFAELSPVRDCFEPVYGHGCDASSVLYNSPVAFWSTVYADVIPETSGGAAARCFYLGVEPYYFDPAQVKAMMDVILFDEWGLARNPE